jgi:hypothetical protein
MYIARLERRYKPQLPAILLRGFSHLHAVHGLKVVFFLKLLATAMFNISQHKLGGGDGNWGQLWKGLQVPYRSLIGKMIGFATCV